MHPAILNALVLAISLIALALFSDWVVNSGVRLAKLLKLSELAIGFIMISVLTSLPELMVSVNSSTSEKIGLSIGNIFGSNIVDIALVLGLGFYLYPKVVKTRSILKKLSAALLLTSTTLVVFMLVPSLNRVTGALLIALFLFFCYTLIRSKEKVHEIEIVQQNSGRSSKISKLHIEDRALFGGSGMGQKEKDLARSLLHLIIGTIGIVVSSGFVVSSGSGLATSLGIAKSVVGAVVIAFGTSVPELAVELTALSKGRIGIALGDAIGSTVANLTLVLGVSLLLSPTKINVHFFSTLVLFSLLTNIVFWYFLSEGTFGKRQGMILMGIYAVFIVVLFGEQLYALKEVLIPFFKGLVELP
ncbi:MAG: hypothetical protein V1820_00290 [archaeon]